MQATSPVSFPVQLADIFRPEAIVLGLKHRTKPGVIEELVHHLVVLGHLTPETEKSVLQMLLAREKIGTTGLGNGVAVPHCRSSVTEDFIGVVGIDRQGIPFEAVDGEPVSFVFLLLAPLDRREQLIGILGRLIAIGRDKSQRLQLHGCRSAEAVYHFLQELT
jgi:PTS system nitrogen regulatory IIA component